MKEALHRIQSIHEEASRQIETRWKALIGFGCGYFLRWRITGDKMIVTYELPVRQGGGEDVDILPLACFTAETLEEAVKILKEENAKP